MITKETILLLTANFCDCWKRVKAPIDKEEKALLLRELATHIKELSSALKMSPPLASSLLYYFFSTIWGAPFVYSISLSQACKNQKKFEALLEHMIEHHQVIDQEIQVAREQLENILRLKKSA